MALLELEIRVQEEPRAPVFLFDFNDSFTFNIAREISKYQGNLEIVSLDKLKDFLCSYNSEPATFVYGPGPGHPSEYEYLLPLIKKHWSSKKIRHIGICLGHQIFWLLHGVNTVRATKAVHGQSVDFIIPPWKEVFPRETWHKTQKVQRYNSLVIDLNTVKAQKFHEKYGIQCSFVDNGCYASKFPNAVSFQFHPESCGTESPSFFFRNLFC